MNKTSDILRQEAKTIRDPRQAVAAVFRFQERQ